MSRPKGADARHYRVVHRTTYTYPEQVTSSYGRALLLPRSTGGQTCHTGGIRTEPASVATSEHRDFFGNRSTYFEIAQPHTTLEVLAESVVSVNRRQVQMARIPALSWEQVAAAVRSLRRSGDHSQPDHGGAVVAVADMSYGSPMVDVTDEVRAYAAPSFPPGRPIGHAIADLTERIYADFTYASGSTTVRTRVGDVLEHRMGVCQDFAHLLVACARSVGLAARYLSGYLETLPPPGQPKLRGVDASHAWAAVWVPHGGWVQTDPTNDQFVDNRYVVLGWGRDYRDVSPLRGIVYTEGAGSRLSVGVDLLPLEPEEVADAVAALGSGADRPGEAAGG